MDKFYDFVTHFLSRRNNQAPLSSVNLYLRVKYGQRIMNNAFSFSVQQVNLTCLSKKNIGFSLSISGSRTLKDLTFSRPFGNGNGHVKLTSTSELSSLTTLHLHCITLYDGFFTKCPNLENLTLNCFNMTGSKGLRIRHPRLSNLTLDNGDIIPNTVIVATPQLKSLTITHFSGNYLIFAPGLASLLFGGYCPLTFSTDGFHSSEKAQLSLHTLRKSHAPDIIRLLEKLHNVKVLSLSMEITQIFGIGPYVQQNGLCKNSVDDE